MTMKATTVIDYLVQRLVDDGITHCFGVPGDYAFPVCDAVDRNPHIKWIGCSNELNASYAADGFARVKGASMLSTTYAVGELSAINAGAVMGAKGEGVYELLAVGVLIWLCQAGVNREDARLGKEADTLEKSRRWSREL